MKRVCFAFLLMGIVCVCVIRASALVIVDAGHGGADGGAVSPTGVTESPINLTIAKKVCGLLEFFGRETMETRAEENISYPPECSTIRQKKVYDTKTRVELINRQTSAVVISIHQNSLPKSPKTHGAIVFYNGEEGSTQIAKNVQWTLNETVNNGNEKAEKAIGKDIYLMNHIRHPAILVECGFLSNVEEVEKLQRNDYQLKLAIAIITGFLQREDSL